MFEGLEWLYFIVCIGFCIYEYADGEYVIGVIFTILTIVGTVNTVRANLKGKKK